MEQLTDEIKDLVNNTDLCLLSTVSDDGSPRTIPVTFKKTLSDNEVMLVNNYMTVTINNIIARPDKISLTVWAKGIVSHIKGVVHIEHSGNAYEQGIEMIKAKFPDRTPKSVVIVTITSVQTWHKPAL